MSIPATNGFEVGIGFAGVFMTSSENNDEFYMDEHGNIRTKTNRSGGRCKLAIKVTNTRIEIIRKKRNAMQNYLRNDIVDLLKNGLDINAYGRIHLEKMKQKKNWLTGEGKCSSSTMGGLKSPDVEIHVMGSAMEVALVTGLYCQFMFTEIIRMFREEGAEVVNASFSIQDNTVFHTIHSKLGETSAPEDEAARISERLKKCVYSSVS